MLDKDTLKAAAPTTARKEPSKIPERIKHKDTPIVMSMRVKPTVYRKLKRLAKRNNMTLVATVSALIDIADKETRK